MQELQTVLEYVDNIFVAVEVGIKGYPDSSLHSKETDS